jgi:FAD/FMN-containing dehydrogenase
MPHKHLTPHVDNQTAIKALKNIVGDSNVLTSPADLQAWGTDWTKVFPPNPCCIVLPANKDEVAQVLKYCHSNQLALTPSGGRTGLVAGAVANEGEVVLSLTRMNKILHIDSIGLTATVEAGVTTQALQEAARDAGLFFPIDLGAKGSCHIGGNIATNAGGVKLIKYGGMREQVLGLEVILANGETLDLMSALRKNNSGYDLKHLFIGSEGTLGVVTSAVVRLMPKPKDLQLSIMTAASFADIPKILKVCSLQGVTVTAFEFFTDVAHRIVLKHQKSARSPFSEISPFYVLLEIEQERADNGIMESLLEKIFEEGLITDATIATNSTQFKEFWGLRENITESIAAHGHVRKNDISLAIHDLDNFVMQLETLLKTITLGSMELVLFGHIGDGNLHINYVAPKTEDFKDFHKRARDIEEKIFELLATFKGSISAEHGIGLTKKKDLYFTRTAAEVEWMRQIKKLWDPTGILNPGKIFDFESL